MFDGVPVIEPQGRGTVVPRARAGDACEPQRGLKGGEAAGGIPAGNVEKETCTTRCRPLFLKA